jgi:phosphoglucosamine mutase
MTRTLFGTDGVRGVAGRSPMNAESAFALGRATAERLRETGAGRPRIVLGVDTRWSAGMLRHAFTAGALSRGADVVFAGVMPTPGVSYLTRTLGADAGVVVSASHNPFDDNGIKIFAASGDKLPDAEEAAIEAWMNRGDSGETVGDGIGRSERYRRDQGAYRDFLLGHAPYLDGMRVGLDCANGAASELAPEVFERIGARLQVIHATPDGRNINVDCGSTHPASIQEHVAAHGLEVGVTFDGDADRALLVDARGRLVTGDHAVAIVARVRGDREVVGTVMTNLGVERWLEEHGVTTHRTQVGDRYVHQELVRRGLRLGGEASGHLLFLDKAPTGDGLLTALQTLAAVRASGRPLERWMDEIPTYPQVLRNVRVDASAKDAAAGHPDVVAAVAEAERELADEGRVNLRPSGTEPLVRVMVEGRDADRVEACAARVADVVTRVAGA